MVDFFKLRRDFPFGSKSQTSGQAKHRLCTKCSDHLGCWLGRHSLGTDTDSQGWGPCYILQYFLEILIWHILHIFCIFLCISWSFFACIFAYLFLSCSAYFTIYSAKYFAYFLHIDLYFFCICCISIDIFVCIFCIFISCLFAFLFTRYFAYVAHATYFAYCLLNILHIWKCPYLEYFVHI